MNGVSNILVAEEVTLVTFESVPADLRAVSEAFDAFAAAEVNIDMISQSAPAGGAVSVSFTIGGADLVPALEIVNRLREENPSLRPLLSSGNAKITLHGEEMRVQPGVAARAISAVVGAGAELALVTTSEVDISLLLSRENLPLAQGGLEAAFGLVRE